MKIAVLMLVHKNKDQVVRLLSAMNHENIDFFLHVDKKSDLDFSGLNMPNVYLTPRRHDVGLFEFSMVEAEMELIRTARQQGHYDYFMLMSGQCYPITSVSNIYDFLCRSYPEPFIEIVAPTKENYVTRNFAKAFALKRLKIRSYGWLKRHFSYKGYRLFRYLPGGLAMVATRIKSLIIGTPVRRLKKRGWGTYCGSQWWILPDRIIENVLPFFEDREYHRIVSDCFSCDETFFQTAIMARREENGIRTDEAGNYINRKWFFIFHDGHPILLTQDRFREIKESGMLFGRKFDMDQDSEILNLLDKSFRDEDT